MNITVITSSDVDKAKELVLKGLEERFGFLDPALNPDLNDITGNYLKEGSVFLIGKENGVLVCTGALSKETQSTGRIVRMSVKSSSRGQGFARKMLHALEEFAVEYGYTRLVLETNNAWQSAIQLYGSEGFECYEDDGQISHFSKQLK
ncbi:GNAT family N-acetyltransferase [Bacillus sp. BGMRC 2118]|nr:GNAT family N-acetyltransferase [Bacillus sp. BGMRC 2118]